MMQNQKDNLENLNCEKLIISLSDLKLKEYALMSSSEITTQQNNQQEQNNHINSNNVGGDASENNTTTTTTTTTQPLGRRESIENQTQQQDSNRQQSENNQHHHRHRRNANDFRFGRSIGEGSFSTVYLAKDIHTHKEYAIKVCDKKHIIRERKTEYIKREREVLNLLNNCPGFVNLYCTFQDDSNLYFVMTYAKNGDLLPYINKVGSFDLDCTKFYAAELVLAMEQMHCKGIIHRDLKPENLLLDENMHILLADFGSSKICTSIGAHRTLRNADLQENAQNQPQNEATDENNSRRRKNSFVGTAQYVSPEILNGQPSSRASDLWALGCIIYQMLAGLPPFRAGTEYLIFKKVLNVEMSFPEGFDAVAEDLVQKLIRLNPTERIGYSDTGTQYDSIRNHPFFESICWDTLRTQCSPPIYPYLPGLESEMDQRQQYQVPDCIAPGLNVEALQRLIGMDLGTSESYSSIQETSSQQQQQQQTSSNNSTTEPKTILDISEAERTRRMEEQTRTNKWHPFSDGELILKQGFVNKRKGLFARKRMLLLTTGPRLIYIDPVQMVKKGEIPWSRQLTVESKSFKIFFVHTPNRTYYLDDPQGYALHWVKAINEVRYKVYNIDPKNDN